MHDTRPDIASLKPRMKSTWTAGDFGEIARSVESHAETFVGRVGIEPGMRVLDVACGTGNVALRAARAGAEVTGVDIADNLLDQAREGARQEGLELDLREGDAEDLPFDDGSFDLVTSMYGAMFAPRPDRVASELVRTCRPRGRIAMANWPADSFVGRMARVTARHAPPPAGVPSPLLWGDPAVVRERLGAGTSDLRTERVKVAFAYPFSPAETVEFFRTYYGPTKLAFERLAPDEREDLRADLENLWAEHDRAPGDGAVRVETEYLEVVATRA